VEFICQIIIVLLLMGFISQRTVLRQQLLWVTTVLFGSRTLNLCYQSINQSINQSIFICRNKQVQHDSS